MEMYVRTRGDQINQGYRWVHLATGGQAFEVGAEPLIAQKPEASRLIYAEDFALLLARAGPALALHITGLPVTEQSQRLRQNVQNVLVCVAPLSEEQLVRGIAVAALEGSLTALLDRHISMITPHPGFQVDAPGLHHTLEQLAASAGRPPRADARIEADTAVARQRLCEELYVCTLPQRGLYPVVVTRHRSSALLAQARVWRGLTSLHTKGLPLPSGSTPAYLPSMTIRTRNGQALFLPDQFAGELNLVMLGKHMHHQSQGQRWLERLAPFMQQSKIQFYVMLLTASLIDATLKSLLIHASPAQQVIFIAHNQDAFLQALHLERGDTLTMLLIDRAGRVVWHGQGECNDEQIDMLQSRLAER